jgi:ABC-type sugar transport system substrate-binding protein
MPPPVLRRALLLAGLALAYSAQASKPLVMGFSQVGAESEWRTANTASVKSAAQAAGIQLKFADAQQKQENQIKAIRSFIAQKVDVIAFSPVVESGFDTVLREAKAAKIPVVLTDRAVKTSDPSLYVTFIGSDFVEEGRKAGALAARQREGRRAQHRRAAGHRGLGAGHRPQEGLRGGPQGQHQAARSSARRPATSRAPRARR